MANTIEPEPRDIFHLHMSVEEIEDFEQRGAQWFKAHHSTEFTMVKLGVGEDGKDIFVGFPTKKG